MQLVTGVGNAVMSHLPNCSLKISKEHCRYFTIIKKRRGVGPDVMGVAPGEGGGRGGCEQKIKHILQIKKKKHT